MHVLVVTNNAARRFQIRSEIVREGFTVSLASSARAGLRGLSNREGGYRYLRSLHAVHGWSRVPSCGTRNCRKTSIHLYLY